MTPTLLFTDVCLDCDAPISGRSSRALDAARTEHVDYVNTCLDRRVDPHFAAMRLNDLVGS